MSDNIIEIKNLSFSYVDDETNKEIPIIKNLSLDIKRGDFVAVLGHNGSGKSTLAKLINMVLTRESGIIRGSIRVNGREITADDITDEDVFDIRRKIGMVFQNPDNQIVATTVEEDVAFGPENLAIPSEEIRKRVDSALDAVNMQKYRKHAPHRLSGGQKQRVAIAGIIAMLPECIIFDESTAMLDPKGRKEVMSTIEMLSREKNMTVVLITHYMNEAATADKVAVINEGKLFSYDTPEKTFSNVEELQKIGLDVPQVTELLYLLKKEGCDLPSDILHTDDAAVALEKLIFG